MKQHDTIARLTISLPPDLRDRVRRSASEDELPVSKYIALVLRRHFSAEDQREAEEMRHPRRPHQVSIFSLAGQ